MADTFLASGLSGVPCKWSLSIASLWIQTEQHTCVDVDKITKNNMPYYRRTFILLTVHLGLTDGTDAHTVYTVNVQQYIRRP